MLFALTVGSGGWLDVWRTTGVLGGGVGGTAPLPSALTNLHSSHTLGHTLHAAAGHTPLSSHALASITNTELSRPSLLAAAAVAS